MTVDAASSVLVATFLLAIIRPPIYERMLHRLGIFKSARPNDMVVAGLGRTFQNIRLFKTMTAAENVKVGMHSRLRATPLDAALRLPRHRREEKEADVQARRWLAFVGLKGKEQETARNLAYGDQRACHLQPALVTVCQVPGGLLLLALAPAERKPAARLDIGLLLLAAVPRKAQGSVQRGCAEP